MPDSDRYLSRKDLQERHRLSRETLNKLWAERATNGHPTPVVGEDGVMRWDEQEWATWHQRHLEQRAQARRRAASPPAKDAGLGDDELGGPAAFARLLGHAGTSTISRWLKDPPSGFPQPASWKALPSGRQRPQWTYAAMREFADSHRPYRGHAGGRRPIDK
ncbi:hypothetical protein [Streptomyces alkaliterrae]|uniref:Uncharacterized protein n=1 Tax=Streptomyces alkaliterrae TaxID=2213162 RepID=A0A5P0YJZ9_9ACTN|nr:hypothetical protein [Streptomyces alkaliterrae]MBB1258324.1 hypothetical protein [Streptomyces alkaliterrae]MQS00693.1 hypothetical protein [Streptomyces alkaliterrae]